MPKAPKTKQKAIKADKPAQPKGKYVEQQQDILALAQEAAQEAGVKRNSRVQKEQAKTRKASKMDAATAKLSQKKSPLEAAKEKLADNKKPAQKAKAIPKAPTSDASNKPKKKSVKFAG